MEKLKLGKHEHSLTDLLKILIFSIIMLAPFFAIGIQCGYVMFNKNAKDSYSGESTYEINYKYKSNQVNSASDLVVDNIYYFNCQQQTIDEIFVFNTDGYVSLIFINIDEWNFSEYSYTEDDRLYTFYNSVYPIELVIDSNFIGHFYLPQNENDSLFTFMFDDTLDTYLFTLKGVFILNSFDNLYGCNGINYTDYNEIENVNIDNSGTLDNVFYYSIDQLGSQPIFNWTENTAIYTAIDGMTTGLELGTGSNTLALLLTYWSLNTAIYIVFDIIIVCFTKITHFFAKE